MIRITDFTKIKYTFMAVGAEPLAFSVNVQEVNRMYKINSLIRISVWLF